MSQQPPRRRKIAGERRQGAATSAPPEPARVAETAPAAPKSSVPVPPRPRRERPAAAPTQPKGPRVFGWRGVAAAAAATTLVIAVILAAIVWGQDVREADRVDEQRRSAVSTAERAASAILAYDYRTLDANLDSALSFMVPDGELADQFKGSYEALINENATDQQAVVSAKVLAAAPVTGKNDRIEVLLFVDQTTVKRDQIQPAVALNRVSFVMVERGNRWLVESITPY